MAFDPIKIPQNVYVEDRVIGPVSLRQIFMLLGGGGTSYVLWTLLVQAGAVGVVAGTIAAIPTVVTALFAFVKIGEISLARFCLLMIEKSYKPSVRYWQPRTGVERRIHKAGTHPKKQDDDEEEEKAKPGSEQQSTQMDELSSVLDTDV